jgi:hypothetical protein
MIDTGGRWWRGDAPDDTVEYLAAYSGESYRADEWRLARCGCGSDAFLIDTDDEEGVARRTCMACSTAAFLCDGAESWDDAEPQLLACVECGGRHFNACVGFSLYPGRTGVRWVYLCQRCVACGVLGCVAEWKAGHEDLSMIDRAWS